MKGSSGMEASLLFEEHFKEQLLEFIEEREDPFDLEFLAGQCLQPVSEMMIRDVLCELVEEGKVIRIDDCHYLSTRILMKRWLKQKIRNLEGNIILDEIELPRSLIRQITRLIKEKPELGYIDISEFVRDAIRKSLLHPRR